MKKRLPYIVFLILIPAVILCGALLFDAKRNAWISLCVVILSCVPFFLRYEKKKPDTKELVLIAALTALSVAGRMLFAFLPGFKPVTALVVLTALYFGKEAGFMTGALSAVVSNFYFGQGPWTPFQMLSWGLIGFIAGLLASPLKKSKVLLCVYGALSGVMFSMLMDVWTVIWADGYFNISRYAAAIVTALPVTAVYAASNVVFLLLLSKPLGKILGRLKTKYGI
ncbi:MAG: ECF transporter S component [Clostridia bacterium]|nr:ECF transporter S component [Clostridia bacterium]